MGSSLRDGERFEFGDTPEDPPRAVLDREVRRKLQSIARLESLQVEVAELGHVIGLRSKPQTFDFVLSDSGKQITGTYLDSSVFEDLNSVMGFLDRAPLVAITLMGEASADGELTAITDVLGIEAALPDDWRLRLEELGRLDNGWLSPESPRPAEVALRLTEALLLAVKERGIEKPGMFAHAEGGVQLEWTILGRSLEVVVHNDGTAEMCWYSNRMGDDFEGETVSTKVDVSALAAAIKGVLGARVVDDRNGQDAPSPCPTGHAFVDFRDCPSNGQVAKRAGHLRDIAVVRGRVYPPTSSS